MEENGNVGLWSSMLQLDMKNTMQEWYAAIRYGDHDGSMSGGIYKAHRRGTTCLC